MILDETISVNLSNQNIEYYENLGYEIPRVKRKGHNVWHVKAGTKIIVKVEDLPENSSIDVSCKCDCCGEYFKRKYRIIKSFRKNSMSGMDYCRKCRYKIMAKNREMDFSDVFYAFKKRGYELLTTQDEISTISSCKLKYKCKIHGEKEITWSNFRDGAGCDECGVEKLRNTWRNKIWPKIEYTLKNSEYELISTIEEYTNSNDYCLRCNCKLHGEFITSWNNIREFRGCPTCNASAGERRILYYLNKNNIKYEHPKKFDGLLGVGGNPLSYDFYLPNYNLLIEYQGQQHERPWIDDRVSEEDANILFERQVEHDKRKRDYSKFYNYNLLEIWYYDFNNIEDILNKTLKVESL